MCRTTSRAAPAHSADVRLRPFEAEDLASVEVWVHDIDPTESAASWLGATLAESTLVDVGAERGRYTLAITEAGEVVGAVLLSIDSLEDARGEIGFVVGAPWRRRGIAACAIELLAELAFAERGLHRLWAACDPDNAAAIAVLTRGGFAVEGRLVHDRRVGTTWRDSLILGRIAAR